MTQRRSTRRPATLKQRLARDPELLQSLIDPIPDGFFVKDTEGRFLLANRAVAALMEVDDPHALLGRSDEDFYPPELALAYREEERAVLERGEEIIEKLKSKIVSGEERWILVTKLPLFDEAGGILGLVGLSRDITRRRRAEQALEAERNLLRTLIDLLPHSIYVKDVEGRKIMANPVDVEILGCASEAEVLGRTDFEFFPEEVARDFHEDDQTVIRTGRPVVNREEYYRDATGQKRWLLTSKVPLRDADGVIIGLVGMGRDITERRSREAKIAEQAQLLDISSDAIAVWDIRGRIRYWNRAAEAIFGWTAEEAIGSDVERLLCATRPDALAEASRLVTERGAWSGDLRCATKAGGVVLGEARLTLVRDESGAPRSIFCVATDVTEKRAIQTQLLRAQRLESLGTLAGGIAHDLNNVLTPILMSLEALGGAVSDPQARESLVAITRSAERGASIVRQILGFAQGVEGDRVEVRLSELLAEVVQIARETFPKSIDVRLDLPDKLPVVRGDPTQLHQVAMSLIVNARDAMSDGGWLAVTARAVTLDEAQARLHFGARPISYAVVEVADCGRGMSGEVMDRIFDPFFTTKEVGKGTGLGLSLSHSIVQSHGGFISVESEPGRGSIFAVYLPAAAAGQPAAAAPAESEPVAGAGELILLVDDEEPVRETMKRTLERYGYRVVTAGDGSEAVALYVELGDQVRCLITDMMLPHMDGIATIRTLRRLSPALKVIAMSGLLSSGYASEARALGVESFLAKPYTIELLLETVREALREGA